MRRYQLTDQARDDLLSIWDYIARDNIPAADRTVDRLTERIEMLGRQPLIGEPRDEVRPGLRSFPVGNYVIYHRATDSGVVILRVLHGARDVNRLF